MVNLELFLSSLEKAKGHGGMQAAFIESNVVSLNTICHVLRW